MKRGEVWTVAGGPDYAGKPRPAIVFQDDQFAMLDSVTFCPLTTTSAAGQHVRLTVHPSADNGLRELSHLMVDKIMTVPKSKFGVRLGALDPEDLSRLNAAAIVFLGLAAPMPTR